MKVRCIDCNTELKSVWWAFWTWGFYDRMINHRAKTGHINYQCTMQEIRIKHGR